MAISRITGGNSRTGHNCSKWIFSAIKKEGRRDEWRKRQKERIMVGADKWMEGGR
jgi:hypothetical protein